MSNKFLLAMHYNKRRYITSIKSNFEKNEFETIRKFIFLIYKLYSLSNTLAPEVGGSWAPTTPGKNYQCYAERMWSFMK